MAIVEVGGAGGVFQHSLAAAIELAATDIDVTLITATETELTDDRVRMERVFNWGRGSGPMRPLVIVGSFLFQVVPRAAAFRGFVWVQGSFKPWLTLLLLLALRLAGKRFAFSPHNLFARYGSWVTRLAYRWCLKVAPILVVYNEVDFDAAKALYRSVKLAPLVLYVPKLLPQNVRRWQDVVARENISVCAVGQIRRDKNLPMLAEAVAEAGGGLLIAGQDAGDLPAVEAAMRRYQTRGRVVEEYLSLDDLAAILFAVGNVALPYSVASQSGVAVLARAYGCTVIGVGVGGLRSQIDVVVPSLSVHDWSASLATVTVPERIPGELPEPLVTTSAERAALLAILDI